MSAAFVRLLHLFDQLGVLEVHPSDLEWVDQETLVRLSWLAKSVDLMGHSAWRGNLPSLPRWACY